MENIRTDKIPDYERFPSPLGDLYISMIHKHLCILRNNRFRPLSGTYISQYTKHIRKKGDKKFPSPLGDLYISISWEAERIHIRSTVSVPSRGLIYLNQVGKRRNIPRIVSVPSRGLIYLNWIHERSLWKSSKTVSVPSRGLIYLNLRCKGKNRRKAKVSVPSRGLIYLNNLWSNFCRAGKVSVPSRGLIYLNLNRYVY